MSGNGRKIVTPRAMLLRRTMGLRPKRETIVFALIEAAVGTFLPGSFAQRPAREIPPTVETRSWDSVWPEHCHEFYETKTNLLFVNSPLSCSPRFTRCRC